jgi:hypothetical protein
MKAMYNHMMGNVKPFVTRQGRVINPPSPATVWGPIERLNRDFQSHNSHDPPRKPRSIKNRMPAPVRAADQYDLLDRHNKIMAAILTRFRNMVVAATEPLPTAAAIPQASLNAMTMNNEVSALVRILYPLSLKSLPNHRRSLRLDTIITTSIPNCNRSPSFTCFPCTHHPAVADATLAFRPSR